MVAYETEQDPTEVGVYACRVPSGIEGLAEDKFLMWIDGKWGYLRSSEYYRGKVLGWVGPLQRRL